VFSLQGDDGRDGSPGKTGHIGRSVRAPSFNPFNVTVEIKGVYSRKITNIIQVPE
jgi:hypothetical protein